MFMHIMKHSHAVCCGLFLSPKPQSGDNEGSEENKAGDQENQSSAAIAKVIDVVPLLHTSHYLAPAMEIALNSVNIYAQEQELFISGYYQTAKYEHALDIFGQRVTEKITETYRDAVLCQVAVLPSQESREFPHIHLDLHQFVDGKWRRKTSQYEVENGISLIKEKIIFSKEKLYRQIVDFDDHFNDISLDWTNAKISQRIDYLVANVC